MKNYLKINIIVFYLAHICLPKAVSQNIDPILKQVHGYYGPIEWTVNAQTFKMDYNKGYRIFVVKGMENIRGDEGLKSFVDLYKMSNPKGSPSIVGEPTFWYREVTDPNLSELIIRGVDNTGATIDIGAKGALKEGVYPVTIRMGINNLGIFGDGQMTISHVSQYKVVGTINATGKRILSTSASPTSYSITASFNCGVEGKDTLPPVSSVPKSLLFGKEADADIQYVQTQFADNNLPVEFMDVSIPEILGIVQAGLAVNAIKKDIKKLIYPVLFHQGKMYFKEKDETIEKFVARCLQK